MLRQVLIHLGAGRPLDVVYDLLDDGTNPSIPEQNFGQYQSNVLTEPAAEALRRFWQLAGGNHRGFLDMDPRGMPLPRRELMTGRSSFGPNWTSPSASRFLRPRALKMYTGNP